MRERSPTMTAAGPAGLTWPSLARRGLWYATMAARLGRDLPRFLRRPLLPEQARAIVQRRLATREERFLKLVETGIYGYRLSPYRRLLGVVGCELGDLRAMVTREGLEGTLRELAQAGVYVGYEEFKGRREIVRGSERFAVAEEDFDNPTVRPHFWARSGGTRGRATAVKTTLALVDELAASTAVALEAHGLATADHAIWLTGAVLPLLLYARLGRAPLAWFYPLRPLPWEVRLGGVYLQALGRLSGNPLPGPAWNDLRDPARLAAWLARRLGEGRRICVTTYASSAVRVAVAAREGGLSLAGAAFITLGEPFTEAKQRALEAVGARALVRYAFTEAGILAYRCAEPRSSDDLHFFSDCYGLVQRPTALAGGAVSVEQFLFTSLLASAPKVLLNVESGDHGTLERRECGCALGSVGLRDHVSGIRSHEKLSGEGMTFAKTNLLPVLEEILPNRFGGSGADYQVLEEEGVDGILRLVLVVSPGIGPIDEAAVREAFLTALAGDGELEAYMASIWERAGTVEIRRQAPVATGAGKILPFHLARRSGG